MGRAFSDRSFLKILIFSTIYGRFRGAQANLPPPPRDRVKVLYFLDLKEQKIDMMAEQKVALDCIPVEQQGMLEDKDKEDTIGVEVGKLPKWKKKKKSRKKMVAVARNDSIDISADAADAAMLQIIKKEFVNSTESNVEIKITLDYNRSIQRIIGCIRTIEGLTKSMKNNPPDLICFHVKLLPQSKRKLNLIW